MNLLSCEIERAAKSWNPWAGKRAPLLSFDDPNHLQATISIPLQWHKLFDFLVLGTHVKEQARGSILPCRSESIGFHLAWRAAGLPLLRENIAFDQVSAGLPQLMRVNIPVVVGHWLVWQLHPYQNFTSAGRYHARCLDVNICIGRAFRIQVEGDAVETTVPGSTSHEEGSCQAMDVITFEPDI